MMIYGRTRKMKKWHIITGKYANCSTNIKIIKKEYLLSRPKNMCERCSKKRNNYPMDISIDEGKQFIKHDDNNGIVLMEIDEDF